MKNIYDVLREKERQIECVRAQLEALRVVAPLLAFEHESRVVTTSESDWDETNKWPLRP